MDGSYEIPPAWPPGLMADPDWRAAIEMGIDVFLLEANLAITPAERLRQLDEMLALSEVIRGTANDA